ncbi:MAG: Rpn family recombination-promoting nuclease/putative transposase [Puniceicoccaceae bacterium]
MEESPHQPHDKLFKLGFRNPVNAAEFLRHQIPAELAAVIDWQSLASQPGTYVDSQFHNSECDSLFRPHIRHKGGLGSLYVGVIVPYPVMDSKLCLSTWRESCHPLESA